MKEQKSLRSIEGEWRDIIHLRNGDKIFGEWQHNIIVDGINILIACLLSNQPNMTGLTHWAVGEGDPNWDSIYPNVALDPTRAKLIKEIGRVPLSEITFLSDLNEPVTYRTNRIRVSAMFSTNDCLGVWREFAIVGGDATLALNSGIMIDHKAHQKYIKTSDVTVERQIRFIFN